MSALEEAGGTGTHGSKARHGLMHGGHVGSTCRPKGQSSEQVVGAV
jgi:hypothetical protein